MRKEKLYRKVNTRARNVHHTFGGAAKYDRHTKKGMSSTMKQGVKRGLDYTPLYRFLISKVGQNFDVIYAEAVKRLDGDESPIFHIIRQTGIDEIGTDYVRCGDSSLYSRLYVDENNILQFINTNLKNEDLTPNCPCCTHTFNGVPLIRKFVKKAINE